MGTTAVCALSLAGLQAQETQIRTDTSLPRTDAGSTTLSVDPSNPISKANKASGLIGMNVRNSQNEKLGEIKDLVVDLQSGRIGYAVLSVGGFLGIGDKYIAVPPSAFHLAPDQHTLVLDADKAKIQNAPGFAKNEWPTVNNATTYSTYWQTSPGAALGGTGAAATTTGRGSSTLDTTPGTSPSRTTSDQTLTTPQTVTGPATTISGSDRSTFSGRISAINPEARTLTVEGPAGVREFKLGDQPTLVLKENRNPSLTDFKVGFPVTVGYHQENGQFIVHNLTRSDAPEVK